MADLEQKTNPVLKDTVKECEEAARRNDASVWKRVAEELEKPNREQRGVKITDIERNAEDGDFVVVPGKVIGRGRFSKDVSVAALNFTRNAMEAIEEEGEALYIDEAVEEHPSGEEVVLLG
ncbi:MAG: 50S ribosomal protein L18e [Candidatus Nanohaloarchaea archaeon]